MSRFALQEFPPLPPPPQLRTELAHDFTQFVEDHASTLESGATTVDSLLASAGASADSGSAHIILLGLSIADGAAEFSALATDIDSVDFTPDIDEAMSVESALADSASAGDDVARLAAPAVDLGDVPGLPDPPALPPPPIPGLPPPPSTSPAPGGEDGGLGPPPILIVPPGPVLLPVGCPPGCVPSPFDPTECIPGDPFTESAPCAPLAGGFERPGIEEAVACPDGFQPSPFDPESCIPIL